MILTKFRQLRWQFSLASLLGMMLVVSVGATLFGMHARAMQRQERAFQQLAAKGFSIAVYDEGTYIHRGQPWGLCGTGLNRSIIASTSPAPFGEADLSLFDDVRKLRSVEFAGTSLGPKAIAVFKMAHPKCQVN